MKKILLLGALVFFVLSCGSDDSNDADAPCNIPSVDISNISTTGVFVSWGQGNATSATVEYGPSGFNLGTGATITSTQSFDIDGLNPDTMHDVYVRVLCGNGGVSSYAGPFTFYTAPCLSVDINVFNIETTSVFVGFGGNGPVRYEYGEAGFQVGSGTTGLSPTSGDAVQINGLSPGTKYDIYAEHVCGTQTSTTTFRSFTTESL